MACGIPLRNREHDPARIGSNKVNPPCFHALEIRQPVGVRRSGRLGFARIDPQCVMPLPDGSDDVLHADAAGRASPDLAQGDRHPFIAIRLRIHNGGPAGQTLLHQRTQTQDPLFALILADQGGNSCQL